MQVQQDCQLMKFQISPKTLKYPFAFEFAQAVADSHETNS